jgi:hypothetical protein
MCFFHHPEGRLLVTHGHVHLPLPRRVASVAHGCALLPRSRRITSVAHGSCFSSTFPKDRFCLAPMRFFHAPEGTLPPRTVHTLHSLPRGVVSGAHVANAFLDSEESIPTNALHTPFTAPKNRFRPMRCTLLPRSRRDASVMHSSRFFHSPEGSLPSRSAFLPFCRSSEEYRQCVERKVCFARCANCQFPHVRPKPIEYQLTIQRAQLSSVLKIHAGTFHSWIPPRMLTRCAFHNSPKLIVSFASSRPSFLSGHLPSASGSCDLSAFCITVGNSGRCPTPVRYPRGV